MITPTKSFPVFIVNDLPAAAEFYTKNFGFSLVYDSDWYIHMVSEAGIELAFMAPELDSQPKMFQKVLSGEGAIFSFEVESADAAYEHAKSQQCEIMLDIKSEEWGQRHFAIKDPNGLLVDIVQHMEV